MIPMPSGERVTRVVDGEKFETAGRTGLVPLANDVDPPASAWGRDDGMRTIDAGWLGNRLRLARERRGLSQEAVAEKLGLPRTAVTNMESGRRSVSTLELAKLADLYGYPAAFFLGANEGADGEDLALVLRRSLPEAEHNPEIESAIRDVVALCREGVTLRRLLDREPETTIPDYARRVRSAADAIRQAEEVAREERRRLGLGEAPIADIAELLEEQGVWTATTDLPESVSGLFIGHPTVGLVILVNRNHGPVRRRFSWAHEYAHALFDRGETVRMTRRDDESKLVEVRANAFAAAFLVPPGGVSEQLARLGKGHPARVDHRIFDVASNSTIRVDVRARPGSRTVTYQDVAVLARHFGVSFESMVWRMKNLGKIDNSEENKLLDQKDLASSYMNIMGLKKFSESDAMPEQEERELFRSVLYLAIEAFRLGEISRGRLVEIARKLGLEGDAVVELAEAARSR